MGKTFEQASHWRRYMNDSAAHKRCSILLVIREIQTETTMRSHYIPIWMTKCWPGGGGTSTHILYH